MKSPRRVLALTLFSAASLFLATACGTGAADSDDGRLSIVTSTAIWGDVAKAVVPPEQVEVTPIVEGNDSDPHSFEPTAADMARAAEADLIVVGGGGYDAWLYENQDEDKIVHALPLTGHDHSHGDGHSPGHNGAAGADGAGAGSDEESAGHTHSNGHPHEHGHVAGEITSIDGNEHIWYDTAAVTQVAEDIAARVQDLDPTVETDTETITAELESLHARLQQLPTLRVAQTEPIADYLLAHAGATEVTPEGYRASSLSHSEPAAADLAQMLDLVENGDLDLLIYNPQTQTDLTERIRAAAVEADIPVVEIFETPQTGQNFLDFFHGAIDRLERGADEATDPTAEQGTGATAEQGA